MKVKTSITLSEEVLSALDDVAGPGARSALIERVLRAYLRRRTVEAEQERDRALLDEHADALNSEASEVLDLQGAWLDSEG